VKVENDTLGRLRPGQSSVLIDHRSMTGTGDIRSFTGVAAREGTETSLKERESRGKVSEKQGVGIVEKGRRNLKGPAASRKI